MDIKHLQTFLAVADAESFHQAAQQLNITQAAVSSRIRALETELDAKLFLRGPGGTKLSLAGESLRPQATQMLAAWDRVKSDMRQKFSDRIALRLGCQLSIWDALLTELTIWAEENLGKLPLTLNFDHEHDAADLVRSRVVDLSITNQRPTNRQLQAEELSPESMVLVSNRPCALSDPDLALFINLQLGPEYDLEVRRQLGDRSEHLFLGNAAMGISYLFRRNGIAFVPLRMVKRPLRRGRLHKVEGGTEFDLSRFAVFDPSAPAAELIEQILPGVRAVTA